MNTVLCVNATGAKYCIFVKTFSSYSCVFAKPNYTCQSLCVCLCVFLQAG